MSFVDAINSIHDNIWALGIIGAGVALCHWDKQTGVLLIGIGAAVFQKRYNVNGNGGGNGSH